MKTFIILFVLALLFVIGSAGAMRYFDRKNVPGRSRKNVPDRSTKVDDGDNKSSR